jgi:hypothetical protein
MQSRNPELFAALDAGGSVRWSASPLMQSNAKPSAQLKSAPPNAGAL